MGNRGNGEENGNYYKNGPTAGNLTGGNSPIVGQGGTLCGSFPEQGDPSIDPNIVCSLFP